jgi:gluconokinase
MSTRIGPEPPLVLTVDIGTSGVRAALYDGFGEEIDATEARVQRTFETTPEGGAELSAEEALEQVAQAIDAALAAAAHLPEPPEAVALSCFWHSLVGVDDEGRALTPVYGWADMRAAAAAEELRGRFDEPEMHTRTGCRFHPSYWPAKFLWLQKEQKDIFARARRWMTFAEFLVLRLFGETAISISMASGTGLLNLRGGVWESGLLESLSVSLDQLPRVARANEIFTKLRDEYARRWPRLEHARWYPAIGDGAANNIGEGCMTPARAALMIGTSGAMRVMWEGTPLSQIPTALWCYRADYNRLVVGGALSDGGGLYGWLREAFAIREQREATEQALAGMEPDAHGLTIMPFWAGERSTNWSNNARGAILGLTMHTKPLDILRAAMEAVAYRLAFIGGALETVAKGFDIIASGGALLNSPVWAQIIADVLGRPLTLSGVREASSRGAALLALELAGKIGNVAAVPAPSGETYQPDMARHALYRRGLERHQKIYERLVLDQEFARVVSEAARAEENEIRRES